MLWPYREKNGEGQDVGKVGKDKRKQNFGEGGKTMKTANFLPLPLAPSSPSIFLLPHIYVLDWLVGRLVGWLSAHLGSAPS